MHAITLLGARQLRQDYERYADLVLLRLVPPLCPLKHSSYDYSRGATLIAAARASTRQWMDRGGLDCGDFPGQLAIHHGCAMDSPPGGDRRPCDVATPPWYISLRGRCLLSW